MAAGDTNPPEAGGPPVSLSRYRSKRQPQRAKQQPETPEDTPTTPTIPSRYRHRSTSLTRQQGTSPPEQTETPPPPVPPLPLGPLSNNIPVTRSADPLLTGNAFKNEFIVDERIDEEYDNMPRPRTRDSGKSFHGSERKMPPGTTRWIDAPTSFGGSQPDLRSPKSKKSPIFSFLSRSRRGTGDGAPLSPPGSGPTSPPASRGAPAPMYIEAGGKGIVPQVDAPTSASNAGDRRVVVRCMNSSITLPVKTDTTPADILHSAANLITHKIKPDTSLVLESYLQYGLERRLRRYEHVREVMNSWDRDALNALVIIPSDMPENDRDLSLSSVPRTPDPPFSFVLQLYHSPRVGKWSKRIITLTEGGQVYAAKKPGVRPADKDAVSLCHMSDFDVYSPTEHQMRKVLKPPKKYCYAVKSQQKSSVFSTGENFVHFFCTDDGAAAKHFHEQVHGWRSWYLVNHKTDVHEVVAKEVPIQRDAPKRHVSVKGPGHRARRSVDTTPYAIGSFKPLIDTDVFTKSYDEPISEEPSRQRSQRRPEETQRRAPQQQPRDAPRTVAPRQSQESQRRPAEASAPRRKLSKGNSQRGRAMSLHSRDADINANGLLGDKYEERKEEQRRREEALRRLTSEDGPFTEGPSLLNNMNATHESPSRADATSETRRSSSRYRQDASRARSTHRASSPTGSVRRPDMPAPLVDIEDPAADPLSWRDEISKNRGRGVQAPAGVRLVDLATGRSAHKFDPATGTFTSRGAEPGAGPGMAPGMAPGFGAETLVGQVARSQSNASRGGLGRSVSTASRRGPGRYAADAPPLPAEGTLLARYESQKRGMSGTVR